MAALSPSYLEIEQIVQLGAAMRKIGIKRSGDELNDLFTKWALIWVQLERWVQKRAKTLLISGI